LKTENISRSKIQKSTCGRTVVGTYDTFKRVLTRSVPDLAFNDLVSDVHNLASELHTNGDMVFVLEPTIGKLHSEAALAHARLPYHNELEIQVA